MRKPTRFIALILIVIFAAMSVAACGKGNSQTAVADGTGAIETENITDKDKTTSAEKDTAKSDEGQDVTDEDGTDGEKITDAGTGEGKETSEDVTSGEKESSGMTKPQEPGNDSNDKEDGTTASSGQKPDATESQKPTTPQKPAENQKPTTPQKPETPTKEEPTAGIKPPSVPSGGNFSKTAIEIAKEMGDGINLGNTMEAVAGGNPWFDVTNVTNWETAWGQPKTTRAMIDGMKKAGFESIRIPVAWSNMMSKDGTYKIPDVFFDRVDEIIGYAYANGMYVIINIHYDDGWWDDFARDEAGTMKRYKAMWTQIAGHYKDYDEKLIFESANEELGDKLGYALVNRINQAFVDLVRASGGNNGLRYLLIAGFNTDIDKTCSSEYRMPADTCRNHLLISVHYYTPWPYCGMWKEESWGSPVYEWGSAADKAEMEQYFKKMQKFTDAGYGVIVGEYSALPNYDNGSYERKEGAVEFLSCVRSLSQKYGYAAYLWDTGDWYNKSTCAMRWSDTVSLYR